MASASIPAFSIAWLTASRSASSEHQDSPHPADKDLGTGINLPGTPFSLHIFSMAIASAVVWNVTTNFNSFFLILPYSMMTANPSSISEDVVFLP